MRKHLSSDIYRGFHCWPLTMFLPGYPIDVLSSPFTELLTSSLEIENSDNFLTLINSISGSLTKPDWSHVQIGNKHFQNEARIGISYASLMIGELKLQAVKYLKRYSNFSTSLILGSLQNAYTPHPMNSELSHSDPLFRFHIWHRHLGLIDRCEIWDYLVC